MVSCRIFNLCGLVEALVCCFFLSSPQYRRAISVIVRSFAWSSTPTTKRATQIASVHQPSQGSSLPGLKNRSVSSRIVQECCSAEAAHIHVEQAPRVKRKRTPKPPRNPRASSWYYEYVQNPVTGVRPLKAFRLRFRIPYSEFLGFVAE